MYTWNDLSLPCSDVEGVIARANATEYGLASGVFTKDVNKAMYVAENIKAGTVFVNTYNKTDVASPFGGFKQSGFGKDLGKWLGVVRIIVHVVRLCCESFNSIVSSFAELQLDNNVWWLSPLSTF